MDGITIVLTVAVVVLVVALAMVVATGRRRTREADRSGGETTARAEREADGLLARARADAEETVSRATGEARTLVDRAREDAERAAVDARRREAEQTAELDRRRTALADEIADARARADDRSSRLDERESRLDRDGDEVARERARVTEQLDDLQERRRELEAAEAAAASDRRAAADRLRAELERVAGLTAEHARAELMAGVEQEAERQAAITVRDIEQRARREGDEQARRILTIAMQRLASGSTTEQTVAAVHLPGEDLKGRIIGREGRNIRSFETVTGTNVVVDDSPDTVLVSSFDPVRREVARLTMTELVADGRIHPARIEQVYAASQAEIERRCRRAAEDALLEVGLDGLAPELVDVLGQLRYRTSYGQNVLKHLIECAHLAGMVAAELGLDVAVCKRAAFLHDLGKALTHEKEGSHALVGADLARRHGEHPDVVHAIEAHHNEVEPETVEAILVQVVDALSGARPGARRETVQTFTQRLGQLERIARDHDGVDKVFAMQAGRDVRVMVKPDQVDDAGAAVLARSIVERIRAEVSYPGQVQVTVIRESRATATAT